MSLIPQHIPAFSPSTDLLIIATVAAATVGGAMLGAARLKQFSMSIYVGMVLGLQGIPLLYATIGRPGGALSQTNLQFLALALAIGLLGLLGGHAYHKGAHGSLVFTVVAAVLSGLLLVVAGMGFLSPGALAGTKGSSTLAAGIYDTRLIWLLATPIALMVATLFKGKRR